MNRAAIGITLLNDQYCSMVEDCIISMIVEPHVRLSSINRYYAQYRLSGPRKSWANFQAFMTDKKFRRYFRMSKQLFKILCDKIQDIIPPHEFKSEEYLEELLESPVVDPSRNILFAHAQSTGGFVSGEIKLAITLRILGGATYMDCALLFEISFNHAHKIVKSVVQDWLLHKSFYPISGITYCRDDAKMREVALQFSQASRGVINNCVGALDGWVVKIKKPTKSDGVDNPQSFYSRKGYYGINAQVIVDKRKKILSRSVMSRGAEHDSTAFRNSELYKWLMNYQTMAQKGFHFIGDSAYALKSFLLTLYDNAAHGSAEDNYNFFHSSSRISVECCFGEIDLCFGIFWQPLKYSLNFCFPFSFGTPYRAYSSSFISSPTSWTNSNQRSRGIQRVAS